jgi:hypothetical protein
MEVTKRSPYQSTRLLQAPHSITTTICIYLAFFNCWKLKGKNKECYKRFLVFSSSAKDDNKPPSSSSFFCFFLKCRRWWWAKRLDAISWFFSSYVEDYVELGGPNSLSSLGFFVKCRRRQRAYWFIVIPWFFSSSAKDDDELGFGLNIFFYFFF